MGAPEGCVRKCARGRGQTRTCGGSACVSKPMFHLISSSPPGRRLTGTHNIVVPGASFICQEVNLSEIESENNARKILKSCMTGDYMFSPFCRISDSKIDCIRGTLKPV